MDKKTTGIVAYITWIGWLIAFLLGDKEGAKFHLNQALVIWLIGIVNIIIGRIPFVGGIISFIVWVFTIACAIIGFIGAINDEEKEIPVVGSIKILK